MYSIPSGAQQVQLLSRIGINSNSGEIRVAENSGVIANIVDLLPKNSWLSQLLVSWFGDSGTKAVVNFVDQVRDGHGADVSKPVTFVTSQGKSIEVWDSGYVQKSELSYRINGGDVTTIEGGSVVLLCVELTQAARRVLDEQEVNQEDLENLKKINFDGFTFIARLGDDFTGCDLRKATLSLSILPSPWWPTYWNTYLGSEPGQEGTLLSTITSINDPVNRVSLVNQLLQRLGHASIDWSRGNVQHKVLGNGYNGGSLTVFEDVLIPFLFSDPVYLQDKDIKLYLRAYYISPKIAATNEGGLLVANVEEVKLILEKYEALTPWMGTLKVEMRDNQNFFKELFALCKTPGYESVKGRAEVLEKIFDVALVK